MCGLFIVISRFYLCPHLIPKLERLSFPPYFLVIVTLIVNWVLFCMCVCVL